MYLLIKTQVFNSVWLEGLGVAAMHLIQGFLNCFLIVLQFYRLKMREREKERRIIEQLHPSFQLNTSPRAIFHSPTKHRKFQAFLSANVTETLPALF